MSVYVDVLLVFNFYIDYVLLYICGKLCRVKSKTSKLITASLFGAISSLYILLPLNSQLCGFVYSAIISMLLSLIAYGKQNLFKNSLVLYTLNCLFNGICLLVWSLTKDNRFIINNNIVYFNLSPLTLIISTVIIYFAIASFRRYFRFNTSQNSCKVIIEYGICSITINCLIDSGNLLKDNITDKPIIIVNKESCYSLLNITNFDIDSFYSLRGFRIIPIKSINSDSVLITFKPDKIIVCINKKQFEIDGYIAISENDITNGYKGIIGSYALSLGEEITYA